MQALEHKMSGNVCIEGGICKTFNFIKPGMRQQYAGLWLARSWFLKIDPVQIISMHVCVCPRPKLLITRGVMWRDMDLI